MQKDDVCRAPDSMVCTWQSPPMRQTGPRVSLHVYYVHEGLASTGNSDPAGTKDLGKPAEARVGGV
jgi:hypothetical protein